MGDDGVRWPLEPDLPRPPDPEPLPLDALPPALRAHVESVAAATQTPTDMAALLTLAAVSAALRGVAEIRVDGRDWREMGVLYAAVVAPPAARKSPVYAHMIAPLVAWERDALEAAGPAHRRAMDAAEVARAALTHVRGQAARGRSSRQDVEDARTELDAAEAAVPSLPRLLAADATPEALVRIMASTGGSVAVLAPEGDPLALADGRYSDAARVDELLRAWGGESIRVDRIAREPLRVDRPALTMGVCVQPAALEALQHARVHRGRGLWARIIWCAPDHGLGRRLTGRDVPSLDVVAAQRYARVLRSLADAAWADGRPTEPHVLEPTDEALEIVYTAESVVEAEMGPGGEYAAIADVAGKLVGQALRLAVLLELAARAEDGRPMWSAPLGAWAVDGGWRLARAAGTHAMRILAVTGVDAHTSDLAYVLRRVRDVSEGEAVVTVRDVHRATADRPSIAGAERPVERLMELLAELEERGCIRQVPQPSTGGRPPSPLVELHPSLRADPTPVERPVREVAL